MICTLCSRSKLSITMSIFRYSQTLGSDFFLYRGRAGIGERIIRSLQIIGFNGPNNGLSSCQYVRNRKGSDHGKSVESTSGISPQFDRVVNCCSSWLGYCAHLSCKLLNNVLESKILGFQKLNGETFSLTCWRVFALMSKMRTDLHI